MPLVVAHAITGSMPRDLTRDALGSGLTARARTKRPTRCLEL